MKRPPKCYECGCSTPEWIDANGEPARLFGTDIGRGADGTPIHAWRCVDCGSEYGDPKNPYKLPPAKRAEEWLPLVQTMLPAPIEVKGTELWGGDPATVMVTLDTDASKIRIMEARIEWVTSHSSQRRARAFATVPFRTPALRVAELIRTAHSKRLAEYRWCPRCHKTFEPERMLDAVCHGCAERVLGVCF